MRIVHQFCRFSAVLGLRPRKVSAGSVQGYVLALVDNTHTTATKLLHNAVVRDGLADQFERDSKPVGEYGRTLLQASHR